jgi:porin
VNLLSATKRRPGRLRCGRIVACLPCLIFVFVLASNGTMAAQQPNQGSSAPEQEAPSSPPGAGTTQSPAPAAPPSNGPATPQGFWARDLLTGDWDGLRKKLADDGMTLSPTYYGEVFGNPSGGARQGATYDGLLDLEFDLDLEKMSDGGVDGLTIHASALYLHGTDLSQRYVGDFSDTSDIAGYNSLRLQELWLQKWFWDKRLSIEVGNMAVDTEFFQSSSASLFINGTFGAFTLIANNVPDAPVYPLASPGVRFKFLPTPATYVMAGVYGMDVHSDPATNNRNGTRFALAGSSGMLIMTEAGFLLNQGPHDSGLQGGYRVGSFVHTYDYPAFGGGGGGTDYGIYGVMDQQLYVHGGQVVSLFVRSGGGPSDTNFVDYYVEGGFNFAGFIPGRDNDVAGLAIARSHVSPDFSAAQIALGHPPSTAETVLEATYKVQLAPWWNLQPDLQYIITPSGVEGSRNATVLGLRTTVAF